MPTDSATDLLHTTVASVLQLAPADVNATTAAANVPAWDSVTHLNLVMAIEEAFGAAFSPEEMLEMTSVAQIREALARHGK